MKIWKVKYVNLQDKQARRPFYKRHNYVEADSRKEAISKVQNYFGEGYGEFTASSAPPEVEKADYPFYLSARPESYWRDICDIDK